MVIGGVPFLLGLGGALLFSPCGAELFVGSILGFRAF